MALGGLFREGLVEWVTTMTYQAASGAGAAKMLELMQQMGSPTAANRLGPAAPSVEMTAVTAAQRSEFPVDDFGAPLAGSLLAWIDKGSSDGQTREEWKGGRNQQDPWDAQRRFPWTESACASARCGATARD